MDNKTLKFIELAKQKHGNKYDYKFTTYIGATKPITIVCPKHGKQTITACIHLRFTGCPKCKIETIANKRRLTMERFLEVSRSVHGDKYDYSKVVLGNNATRKQHVTIICPIHGEFKQQPAKHMDGDNCPKCSGKYQMTTEEFKDIIHSIYGDRYDTSKTVYTRKDGKCIIGCPVHGFVKNSIESLRRGAGCNLCNSSTGENLVSAYLDKVGIKYEREYSVSNFGDKNRYRYDFYLPTLNIVIEFHGQQHYEAVDYFGGIEGFKRAQKRDAYKEQLLKKLNIPLLIIKYDKVDALQTIIAQFINKLFPYEYQGVLYPTINRLSKDVHLEPNTPVEDIAEQYNSLTYLLKPVS